MTLRELRAFTTAARLNRKARELKESNIVSWQVRTLATYIALTVPVEKKGADNPLFEAAKLVAIDPMEREALEAMYAVSGVSQAGTGAPQYLPEEEFDPYKGADVTNAPGSFERAMAGFR